MHRYGWKPSLPDPRDVRSDVSGLEAPPAKHDPRHRFPWGILDQGQLGSCTANTINRHVQLHYLFARDIELPDLSRLFTYYEERRREGTLAQGDAGAVGRDGFRVAKDEGIPLETVWPYLIGRFDDRPPEVAYTDPNRGRIERFTHPDPTWLAFTTILARNQGISFGFTVFESFEGAQASSTGHVPMPSRAERVLGGHEMLIVGYVPGAFICENSWGEGWGDGGFCYMPAEYVLSRSLAGDWRTIPRR